MPSNFTENFNLSQWEPGDKVQRTDFNADNAKIDAALGEHTAQISKLGNCEVHYFTYVGDGTFGEGHPTVINFRKMPLFAFVHEDQSIMFITGKYDHCPTFLLCGSYSLAPMSHTWEGNTLLLHHSGKAKQQFNEKNITYAVVAFYAADEE